jgi:hypothetical protein
MIRAATHEDLVAARNTAYIELLERHQQLKGNYQELR